MRRTTSLLGCLAALLLSVSACSSSGSGSSGSDGKSGSVIKIGFVYEGGGGFNSLSLSFVHGIKVAAQEINKNGGVTVKGKKYTFEIDTCNDHFDQTQATPCVNKLVRDHGDKFMFGGLADFGPIVRGVTEKNRVIYFSTGTAVAALMKKSHYVVNAVPTDEVRAASDVMAIQKFYPNAKRVALLGDQTLTWDKDIQFITEALKKTDLQIVAKDTAPLTVNDYSNLLTHIKASNPDVLVSYMSLSSKTKTLLEENARLHAVPAFFDPSGACEAISAGANGVPITSNLNIGAVLAGPQMTDRAKKYLADFYADGYQPNPDPNVSIPAYDFDSVGWLAQAMNKAGTTSDVDKILEAMNKYPYTGLNGTIHMKDNQETYGQVMCHSETGGAPFTQTLITPPEAS